MTLHRNTQRTLSAFNARETTGDFIPSFFGIEVTRHCNFACVMCPHPEYSSAEKGHMPEDLFRHILTEIGPHAEIINLHWIGEPLLHPRLISMIRYARENSRATLLMSTNASLLRGALAEDIRTSGLDRLILSVDGNSALTFEAIRERGNFAEVCDNVERFVRAVEERGGPVCQIKLISFKSNAHEVEGFLKRWRKYKRAIVDVMWLTDWAGNVPGAREQSDYHNPVDRDVRSPCSDLWFRMQIDWRGTVALCCLDARGSIALGNLGVIPLREIWHSPETRELRRAHIAQQYPGICSACKDWARPQEYEFWYTKEQLQSNPGRVWTAPEIPEANSEQSGVTARR